jgi:hypothetical protein
MVASAVSVVQAFFDRGGLRAVFEHARNAVVATIIVAAGLDMAGRVHVTTLLGLVDPLLAGYVVAGAGFALIALNLVDGLRKLANLRWHVALQAALGLGYLLVSFRIVQLVIFMRTHSCLGV